MRKQIAGALVASLLMGALPVWAGQTSSAAAPSATDAQGRKLRESIDRAIDRSHAPQLTAQERKDLETRQAALKTNPVARGGGSIVMLLLGTALSVGATAYFINKAKKDTVPPALAGH